MDKANVTLMIPNYGWFGMRDWHEPTLSVPILTAILNDVCNLSLLDANADRLSLEETKDIFAKMDADIVLITALSVEYHKQYHTLAKLAKEEKPECVVIMGGVYPTVLPEEVMKDPNVDYAMLGHAEERLNRLIKLITLKIEAGGIDSEEQESQIRSFDGLAYRLENGEEVIRPVNTYISDVKEMVKPDYRLMDLEKYIGNTDVHAANFNASSRKRNANIVSGYGCPYNCLFCATRTISGRRTVFRPAGDVLDEVDYLVKNYHIDSLSFVDDCILADRERAEVIFHEIIDRKYNLEIKIVNLAAWHLDEPILRLMKEAGVSRVGIAIESGSDRVLHEIIHKPLKREIIPPLVKLFRKYDILMTADFVIGFPGETWEEIRETFAFAEKCDIDLCMFHIATVLPKTELYKIAMEQRLLPDDFSFMRDGINWGYCIGNITTDEFTPQELMIMRAFEWDRINFSTPERRERARRVMEVSEEELKEHRKQTRRKLGLHC